MKPVDGYSPWPQWRTHWHVLHAWPASAQVLLLICCGLCLTVLGSLWLTGDLWQRWWDADQEDADMHAQIQQLQTQWNQHQTTKARLLAMPHPSGEAGPAWLDLPTPKVSEQEKALQQLARQHGLQFGGVSDEGGQWTGTLPQLLAAWQNLIAQQPQQRLVSFELKRLVNPHANKAVPEVQMTWRWTTAFDQEKTTHMASNLSPPSGVQLLHNPFAADGLQKALPPAAFKPLHQQNSQSTALEEMHWLGMLSQSGETRALVSQEGLVRVMHLGEAMGQDWGEVVHIAPDHLLLKEWRINDLGHWHVQTTRFPAQGAP